MITASSKFFYGLAGLLMVSAVLYGYTTGGGNVGPISLGYKGAVGDLLGYSLLAGGATLSAFIGLATNAFRDADPDVAAEMLGTDRAPVVPTPQVSYWPIVGAFGVGLTVVGLVLNNVFFVAGLLVLGAVAIEWTMQTWAERATGDPAVNRELRNRIMLPLEVPIAGAAVIALVIVGYSRVFLTVSKENAVWAALAVAATIFIVGTVLSTQKQLRKDVLAGVLALAAVVTIAVGILGALQGEREFHHLEPGAGHETDEGDDAEHGAGTHTEEGAAALEESN